MITSKITQGIKNGDAKAIEYLYTNQFNKFAAIAYRYTKNWEDAKDVASEAFIRITKYIKYLKDDDQLLPWCTTIIKNTALNFLRKKKTGVRV
jgi:RNA polymerase sigma factor (sigma-70 family)